MIGVEEAVEAGIETACEAVGALPMGQRAWAGKEYMIAETAARAAISAHLEALERAGLLHQWQPIGTAPKETPVLIWDGSHVYLASAVRMYVLGNPKRPAGYQWYVMIGDRSAEYPEDGPSPWVQNPTHWQPLPSPPAQNSDEVKP